MAVNYLRSRQSVTNCRGVKSKAWIVHTGVLQGSKMSPTFGFFYKEEFIKQKFYKKRTNKIIIKIK